MGALSEVTSDLQFRTSYSSLTILDRQLAKERAEAILSATPRPFIRWAGSKQRLLSQMVDSLPESYGRYFEPFFGAGALFFLLQPERATLGDYCRPLVDTYDAVANDSDAVIKQLAGMNVLDREEYYRVRAEIPGSDIGRAARFIYLNRAGWNGLYRENSRGEFNVPYGMPRSSLIVDEDNLRKAAGLLGRLDTKMVNGDFEATVASAAAGDLVFFDPPYATSKRRESFVDYNSTLFSWDDQRRLASLAEKLRKQGVRVMVSNAYNSAIQALYPNFGEVTLVRRSSLASKKIARVSVAESLFVG